MSDQDVVIILGCIFTLIMRNPVSLATVIVLILFYVI